MASRETWPAVWVAIATFATAACGPAQDVAPGDAAGQVKLALTATAGSTTYVLANATFGITRTEPPSDVALRLHQTDPTAGDLIAPNLSVGRYTVALLAEWQLERVDSPTSRVGVEGVLVSPNPATVSVFSGQTTSVTLQFQTTGIPLTFGPGAIDIGIDVSLCDPMAPPHPELNVITNSDFEAGTDGWSAVDGTIALSDVAHCGRHSAEITFSDTMNVVPRMGHFTGLPAFGPQYVLPDTATPTTYEISGWVRHDGASTVEMGHVFLLRCDPDGDYQEWGGGIEPVHPNTWKQIKKIRFTSVVGCTALLRFFGADVPHILVDDVYAVPVEPSAPPGPTTPQITAASFSAIQGVPSMPVVARVTDADVTTAALDLTAEIDWSDGTVTTGLITGGAGAFEVSGLHTYASAVRSLVTAVSVSKRGIPTSVSASGMATVDPAATASGEATCVLQQSGSIACWGDNSFGEALPPAGTFTSLTMTADHGCALSTEGSAVCWGKDPSVPPAGPFVQVATGASAQAHSCGLRPDGSIECWGDDNFGGSTPPAGTFIQVTAGDGHACAIRSDYTVTCWGYLARYATIPTGPFRALAEGGLHACGLRMDGTIACWGNNDWGQTVAPGGRFVGITAGDLTTCALDAGGSITCWGYDQFGQGTPPAGIFRSLVPSARYDFCAYRDDGALVCWGLDTSGQATPPGGTFLGISVEYARLCRILTDHSVACLGQPGGVVAPPPPGPFTALASGAGHTCGIRPDGTVACWGDNGNLQASPPAGTFVALSAGWAHTCGLRSDGTAACWGYDYFGQATPPAGTFTGITAGGYHSCGLRNDGGVTCWGYWVNGQTTPPSGSFATLSGGIRHTCGIRTPDGGVACWGDNAAGQATPPPGAFTALAAGEVTTCGIRQDGTLACWGDDTYGAARPPSGAFKAVAMRVGFGCALRLDGSEACWGSLVR